MPILCHCLSLIVLSTLCFPSVFVLFALPRLLPQLAKVYWLTPVAESGVNTQILLHWHCPMPNAHCPYLIPLPMEPATTMRYAGVSTHEAGPVFYCSPQKNASSAPMAILNQKSGLSTHSPPPVVSLIWF